MPTFVLFDGSELRFGVIRFAYFTLSPFYKQLKETNIICPQRVALTIVLQKIRIIVKWQFTFCLRREQVVFLTFIMSLKIDHFLQ